MSVSLELKGMGLSYGDKAVLKDCNASLGAGITVIMGPNGSGKSTLLRACALLEEPTEGEIYYSENGKNLDHDIALRRRLTLVLSRGGLFNASALSNAAYGLRVRGVPKVKRIGMAMEALEAVGLEHLARQNAVTLSSGEAQRLALARALSIGPEVLFLDEPTASVDEENTALIEELIIKMNKGGTPPHVPAIVLTTHDRDQASRLAGRVLTMSRGTIVRQ
ncbi:MAG: ATP-binding cassette domain-containing protein [Thermodesulfovibrionales bacterium]|nr:ATP-binding cassette domain-containing protein [Thermodesulfovibrionales bacterium]